VPLLWAQLEGSIVTTPAPVYVIGNMVPCCTGMQLHEGGCMETTSWHSVRIATVTCTVWMKLGSCDTGSQPVASCDVKTPPLERDL
jgi:hypothetical protein